ncbi:MAG: hypothetical protein ACR2LE_02675 [Nocardioidaceae bacterium]
MRWPLFALFALLPLQWFAVASTPLGQSRLHQIAIFGFALCVLVSYRLRTYAPVLRTAAVFVIANLYMVAAIAAVAAYQGQGPGAAVQQLLYLMVFVAVGGFFFRVADGREPRLVEDLRWVAAVLCVSLLIGFSAAMLVNGVNPVAVLAKTISAGDPEIFQKEVFKSAFAGFGLDDDAVQGNLRHEIFGSVLLSMLISTWAMRVGSVPSPRQQIVYRAATVTGTLLLMVSLSRSVLIAAAMWPLLVMLRSGRRGELSTRQLAILFGAAAAACGVLVSGLGRVIYNRFVTDTTGYEARAGNYGDAVDALPNYWTTGGYDTAGVSSHNFVVDTLLRNGIFAALPAAVIVGLVLVVFALLAAQLYRLPSWMVPVVAVLALPLVRLGTSGGGSIPPVEWLALAFVVGVLSAWRRQVAETVPHPRREPLALGV